MGAPLQTHDEEYVHGADEKGRDGWRKYRRHPSLAVDGAKGDNGERDFDQAKSHEKHARRKEGGTVGRRRWVGAGGDVGSRTTPRAGVGWLGGRVDSGGLFEAVGGEGG